MNNFFFICLFIITFSSTYAQEKKEGLPDLIAQLNKAHTDSGKVNRLLALANFYIVKTGEQKADLDSAQAYLQLAEKKSNAIKNEVWLAQCDLYYSMLMREKKDVVSGKKYINTAIIIFSKHQLTEEWADALNESAVYYSVDNKEEAEQKVLLLKQGAGLYEQAGANKKLANSLKVIGDIYCYRDEFAKGIPILERSLSIYHSINYKAVHEVYDLLGSCYSNVGDYKKGIENGLLAIKTAQEVKDTGTLCTLYNRLALSYYNDKLLNEAAIYFNKSLSIAKRDKDTANIILLTLNTTNVLIRLHQLPEAISLLKNVEKNYQPLSSFNELLITLTTISAYVDLAKPHLAEPYAARLLQIAKKDGYTYNTYRMLIKYNLAIKQYDEVYRYCDFYEKACKDGNVVDGLSYVYLWRFKADSSLGKYVSAIQQFQLYKTIEDSLYNEKKSKQISALNIEYETSNKTEEIKSRGQRIAMVEKEKLIEVAKTNKAIFTRNVIIAGTAMLILLLGLLFNQYKITQKQYQLKQEQYAKEQASNEQLLINQQEINTKNTALENLVAEKEWLVKEIHHRVKNNLQIVMSLLNTQSAYSNNEQSYAAILESRQRMYAMSLIHQKLYQTDNMTLVNMNTYIPELVNFLKDSFPNKKRIEFELNIIGMELDVAQAVPVGLILNEAITNAMKYAFTDMGTGTIIISLNSSGEGECKLKVQDNGKGLVTAFNPAVKGTMGISLMKALSEQLSGKIDFINDNGLTVTITFKQRFIQQLSKNKVS